MTDEEKAEEYCNHLQSEMLAYTPENPRRQRTVTLLDVEEAFLAGLKVGRPQWHDLQKDPKDLPKERKRVLVYADYGNAKELGFAFWNGFEFSMYVNATVLKWCEIPTFDKE